MLNLARSAVALGLVAAVVGASYAQQTITKKQQQPDRPNVREAPAESQDRPQVQNRLQQRGQTQQQDDRAIGQRGHALDQYAAACAINENEVEVAISKLAQQKATNADVKAFAETLAKDHTAFIEKLRPFEAAAGAGVQGRIGRGLNQRRDEQRRDGQAAEDGKENRNQSIRERAAQIQRDAAGGTEEQPSRVGERPAAPRAGDQPQVTQQQTQGQNQAQHQAGGRMWQGAIPVTKLTQISDEIAKRCLASAQKELSSKQSDEFDKCFIGMQVAAHTKMVDALSVVQNHVSPELQKVFNEGIETSQRHLTEAKRLMETLDKEAAQTAGKEKKRQ